MEDDSVDLPIGILGTVIALVAYLFPNAFPGWYVYFGIGASLVLIVVALQLIKRFGRKCPSQKTTP